MDLEAGLLCDAATDEGGKLYVLGAFDTIRARGFPLVHPQCAVAFRVRFSRIEEGEHKLMVRFVDEDGSAVLPPLEAAVQAAFREGQDTAVSNFILNIQGLTLKRPGTYSIDLAIDGRHEKSLPLHAVTA